MRKTNEPLKNESKGFQRGPAVVEVTFALQDARAKEVYVCGDFNDWSPSASRMVSKAGDGRWEKRIKLPPGRYEYRFVVDGVWTSDPVARQEAVNNFGAINSVVEVWS